MKNGVHNFDGLVSSIAHIDGHLKRQATKAVNISLTARNWLIGLYIVEYEMGGEDRSRYGERLFSILAGKLAELKISNCNCRQLYRYCDFYRTYPQIVGALSPQLAVSAKNSWSHSHTRILRC